MTPQDGVTLEELNDVLVRSHKLLEGHKDLSVGGVIGTMEERPDQLVAVVGWESVEVCCRVLAYYARLNECSSVIIGASKVHCSRRSCGRQCLPRAPLEGQEGDCRFRSRFLNATGMSRGQMEVGR